MRSPTQDLERFLEGLANEAQPGDRLPTIRELMRRFGASQMLVQRAFQALRARGLIDSQVGRGTFFLVTGQGAANPAVVADAEAAPRPRASAVKSVLLLRRSISIARGRVLAEGLQRRLAADGHRVLEVSYTDPEHAHTVLRALPRFDACVVQSTYKTIPIELLAALRAKTDVLAVDGAALVGTDVEAVGTEWGEPLAAAVALLQQRGHQRIGFATTSIPFLATQLGLRRFQALSATLSGVELQAITLPLLPDGNYAQVLVETIEARLDGARRPPFTALVATGIEDGAALREMLSGIGLAVPDALSVVLLGRTDLANEHADFFDMVGCSVADQIEALYQAILARWSDASTPYGVRLTPVTRREGASMSAPPKTGPVRRASR